MAKFPVSEQLERGSEVVGNLLTQTTIGLPSGYRETGTIQLPEAWGPFTHIVFRSSIDPTGYRGTEKPSILDPSVSFSLKMVGLRRKYKIRGNSFRR
jgi:hypothetical protein